MGVLRHVWYGKEVMLHTWLRDLQRSQLTTKHFFRKEHLMALVTVTVPTKTLTVDTLKASPQPCVCADYEKDRLYIITQSHKGAEWCMSNLQSGDTKWKPRGSFVELIDKAVDAGMEIKTYANLDDLTTAVIAYNDGCFSD